MKVPDDFHNIRSQGYKSGVSGCVSATDAIEALKFFRNTFRKIVSSIFYSEAERKLVAGDIIGICRGAYDHYGVYINDESVIHYSSKHSDASPDNSIIATSLETFMRGDDTVFKLWFPRKHEEPSKIVVSHCCLHGLVIPGVAHDAEYHLYTPEETVSRAKSRLGEHSYSLLFNNCEHFAIWCKTGISESHQLNQFLRRQKDLFITRGINKG